MSVGRCRVVCRPCRPQNPVASSAVQLRRHHGVNLTVTSLKHASCTHGTTRAIHHVYDQRLSVTRQTRSS